MIIKIIKFKEFILLFRTTHKLVEFYLQCNNGNHSWSQIEKYPPLQKIRNVLPHRNDSAHVFKNWIKISKDRQIRQKCGLKCQSLFLCRKQLSRGVQRDMAGPNVTELSNSVIPPIWHFTLLRQEAQCFKIPDFATKKFAKYD